MDPMNTLAYAAPFWLPGGNLQTLYPVLCLPSPALTYRRERWELDDDDFLDTDWVEGPNDAPLAVMFHGLEGSSRSFYAMHFMRLLQQEGWLGVVINFRGCSGEPNRLPRSYFAGDSMEIETVLARLRSRFPGKPIHALGISLGGNALLKWLGETGDAARKYLNSAAAVSAPVHMNAAGTALDKGFNRLVYTAHFLSTLKAKSLEKASRFPGLLDSEAIRVSTTFREFDTFVTARLHGYRDAVDYWTRTSSKPLLRHIGIPTLVLNARNDPFMPAHALPGQSEVSDSVLLRQPENGGHVGFPRGPFPGNTGWLPVQIFNFFNRQK